MRRVILTVVLCLAVLCGCGSGREIDDMAYVVAIGVDESQEGLYGFTFAIGNPDSINGGESDELLIMEYQTGANIFTAGDAVSARIGQEINFSHAELLVFSDAVATQGVADFLDGLTRNLNQRPKLIPAVSESTAQEALESVNSKFEGNPEKYLKKIFESESSPVSTGIDIRTFLCRTKNAHTGTALPRVSIDDGIVVNAMSVFDGEYLVGTFDNVEAYKLFDGRPENISYDINGMGSVMLTQRVKPDISVICGEVPHIDITVYLDATVAAIGEGITKDNLYSAVEASIRERVTNLLNYSRDTGVDIFGFDRYGRKCFLIWSDWETYNWREMYKKAEFNLNVEIKPEKTGLIKGES